MYKHRAGRVPESHRFHVCGSAASGPEAPSPNLALPLDSSQDVTGPGRAQQGTASAVVFGAAILFTYSHPPLLFLDVFSVPGLGAR